MLGPYSTPPSLAYVYSYRVSQQVLDGNLATQKFREGEKIRENVLTF